MIASFVVLMDKTGFVRALKGDRGVQINQGEIAMRVNIEVDDTVFETQPIPVVTIKADRSQLIQNIEVGVNV